jgi:tetratricopeptide (TPR) repeat protein
MENFCKIRWPFTALIFLLIFTSCAQIKSRLSPQTTVQTPAPTPVQVPAPTQSPVKQYMRTGEYQKAIDFYKAEYGKHPQDRLLVKSYVSILEEIKTTADRALDREDLACAGKAYSVLLKNYPDFKGFAHMLSFEMAQINSRLTNCKTALSKKGFQAYREGNLDEAISFWQDNLTIDPNNTDIRKSLNTAKMQQQNLQNTK